VSTSESSENLNEEIAEQSEGSSLHEEHTFNMDLTPQPTSKPDMETLRPATREEIVEETKNKAETEANTPPATDEQLTSKVSAEPVDTEAALRKQSFPTIDKPTFKAKGKGSRATYSKDEVDVIVSELVEQYNANMMKMEKTYLSGLEKTFALKRAAKDLKTKTDNLKILVEKIQEMTKEMQDKENQLLTLTVKVEELETIIATTPEPALPVEEPVEETMEEIIEEPVVEPVEPESQVEYEIPVFTDEERLEKSIAVKLEEAQMEAHKIKLKATSQATEILGEAQHEASVLMEKAEKEIERLTRSITEAAEAKLADAEKRQAQVTKLAKERKAVHRRLQKLYNQEITRLEKQLSDFDEIINSPSE
jgi:hypothetical protein